MIQTAALHIEQVELSRPRLERASGPLTAPLHWNLIADSLGVATRVAPPAQVALFRLVTELSVAGDPCPLRLRVQHAVEVVLAAEFSESVDHADIVPIYRRLLPALHSHIHVRHSMHILQYLGDLNITPGSSFFAELPTLLDRLAANLQDDGAAGQG